MTNRINTTVIIDGANFYATIQNLGFRVDYKRMRDFLNEEWEMPRIMYITAYKVEDDGRIKLRSILDWLSYNGYQIIQKEAKVMRDSHTGEVKKIKGNMDIEIAVKAMEAADHAANVVLFTGDGDFTYLVEALQRKGVRVTVCNFIGINNPRVPSICLLNNLF